MAKYTTTLTGDTAGAFICAVRKQRGLDFWRALLTAYGEFDSGTLSWYLSPDNGVTLIPMTDSDDTELVMTANKAVNCSLTTGSHNDDLITVWVELAGSTAPSIVVTAYDNS